MLRAALVVCAALGGCVQKVDLPIDCRPAPSPAGWVQCSNVDFACDFPNTPTARKVGAFGQGIVMWTSQLGDVTYAVSLLDAESFGPASDKTMKDALSMGHDVVAERHVDSKGGRALELDIKRGDRAGRIRVIDKPTQKRRYLLQVLDAPTLDTIEPAFFDSFAPRS